MAATTTYAQMYSQFKRDIGLDESFGENAELAGKFNGWFNDRLREIWRAAEWSQCVATDGLCVCSDGVVPLPCVVDWGDKVRLYDGDARARFNAKVQDFILNDGWLWVSEKKASRLFALGESAKAGLDSADGMCFMRSDGSVYRADSQNQDEDLSGKMYSNFRDARLRKGDVYVVRVWGSDLFYSLRAYLYNGDAEIQLPAGTEIDFEKGGGLWLGLSSLPFAPAVWLRYKAVAPSFDEKGVDGFTGLRLSIPVFMKRYVQLAVHSDWLRSVNRHEEAETVMAKAERVKDEEIYRYEMFSTNVAGERDCYGDC